MMSMKGALSGAKGIASGAKQDDFIGMWRGLVGLTITLLSGFSLPILGLLRHKFGERFFLVPERLFLAIAVQFLFFYILKGIGFIWGIFYVGEELYKFFVFLNVVMCLHIGRILLEMVLEKPQYSYSTGSPIFWPLWNLWRRIPWVSDASVRLILEPMLVFIASLFVLRFGESSIGSYLFMSAFALFLLESTIFRQRRSLYLDHKDGERIQVGHSSGSKQLSKPVPIPQGSLWIPSA